MNKLKGIFSKTKGGQKSGQSEASFHGLGYDIREKDLPKIHKAAWTGDLAKVKQLAKKDCSTPDKENRTPLHLACAQGHKQVAQELLEYKARSNVGDNQSKTPLMKAVECNQEDCVRLLLDYKTEVNSKDSDHNTALHIAVKEGLTKIVVLLLQNGADVNAKNRDGMTPLIMSVRDPIKREDHTKVLLDYGAKPDDLDNSRRTALHHACMEDSINHVKLLLQKGASTNIKDAKGWTAEDCAMMKANHGCSQVIFDHNLRQRKVLGGSVPSTPRANSTSSYIHSQSATPRDHSVISSGPPSEFGLPQTQAVGVEDAYDSDDQTVSKHSLHENRQDSWADDTDVSSAMDDHKLKGVPPKTSLTKHVKMNSDEDDDLEEVDLAQPANGKPGDVTRPMYSRTPTPDDELRQGSGNLSRIPVRHQGSVGSGSRGHDDDDDEEDEDFSDDDEDVGVGPGSHKQQPRVSFSEKHDVKNISATDDDTDIDVDDEDEEVVPHKKKRVAGPVDLSDSSSGYTPTGQGVNMGMTPEKFQDSKKKKHALMKDLGIDDASDESDLDESSLRSPRDSLPTTPRGILKKSEGGNQPSVKPVVETDDEESDWDSTRQSVSEPKQLGILRSEVESPEIDNDLEDTLNPEKSEKSQADKDPGAIEAGGNEETSANQDSNTTTVEVVQVESTTEKSTESQQDKLANTGDVNQLIINDYVDSSESQGPDSRKGSLGSWATSTRSGSFAMETQKFIPAANEKTDLTENDQKSSLSQDIAEKIKEASRKSADNDFDTDSENESIDKIEVGNADEGEDDDDEEFRGYELSGVNVINEFADKEVAQADLVEEINDVEEIQGFDVSKEDDIQQLGEGSDGGDQERDCEENFAEIEELIDDEMEYYDDIEKSVEEELSKRAARNKDEIEKSFSEGKAEKTTGNEFRVLDRDHAPKVMLEYEPSTTEAESGLSDSDTLDTESMNEDFVQMMKGNKRKARATKTAGTGSRLDQLARESTPISTVHQREDSTNSDKEIARALAIDSPSTIASRQQGGSGEDGRRGSTEPITGDTLGDGESLAEEGSETSHWDSTDEGYTPRTPRMGEAEIHDNEAEVVPEYDDEEDDVEDQVAPPVYDKIHEVVTSFGASRQEVEPSPLPPSDSSHQRSFNQTPELQTSSNSTSAQKTVIQKQTAVTSAPDAGDDESDWDSEAEENSVDEVVEAPDVVVVSPTFSSPVVKNLDSPDFGSLTPTLHADSHTPSPLVGGADAESVENTPRTPRQQTASTMSEEESMSEWEIEKQQEREARERAEEEARLLREMEEEEERLKQWEQEEQERIRKLEEEARNDLLREQSDDDSSEFSDDYHHSDEGAGVLHQILDHSHPSQHAPQHSQNASFTSEKSDASKVPLSPTSPTARPLLQPPPKLVVSKILGGSQAQSNRDKSPVQIGEIENESPAPFYEDMVEQGTHSPLQTKPTATFLTQSMDSTGGQTTGGQSQGQKTVISAGKGHQDKGQGQMVPQGHEVKDMYEESDVDIEEINDEEDEVDEFMEEHLLPEKGQSLQRQGHQSVLPRQQPAEVKESEILSQTSAKVETTRVTFAGTEPPSSKPVVSRPDNEKSISDLLGTPPPLPKASPPTIGRAMSLRSDGHSIDDEDVDDYPLQQSRNRPLGPSLAQLPDLSGSTGLYVSGLEVPFDDDGLSVTSTENGDISSSYRPENLPYGKDMLVNMNLNDSNAVLKLQEHLREHRKQLEYERSQKQLFETKNKHMVKEKADHQKQIDSLKYQRSVLEQTKLDMEAKIRKLEYCKNDEEEKKKNAELLLKKTKEQLDKKEEQYTQEIELKQKAELAMRNVQMELRAAQNMLKDLEGEKADLERQLTNEKNARQLQEKLNKEQERLQQHIQEESFKTSSQREEAKNALELADDDIKSARDRAEKYRTEVLALKAEIQRQRTRHKEENAQMSNENDMLQQKLDELTTDLRNTEDALTEVQKHQIMQQNKYISDNTMIKDQLEKERLTCEKIEAELESYRNRLQSSTIQVEKAQQARNDSERRLHEEREDFARQSDRKDKELAELREKVQAHMHAFNQAETKLNALDSELQISNSTLLERNNQYQQSQRDVQFYKTTHENHEANMRHEKELNAKLHGKVESLQDRLSGLQHENLSLKQQLDTAQHLASERAGFDLQDKLNTMIGSLKADHDKARASLEDKNTTLQETIARLREEVRNSENRRSNLEQDIRRLNQEQNELIRKLSIAEASLDVANKAREQLEQERLSLKMEIEKLQSRYNTAQEKTIEAQTRMGELVSKLDQTEQSRQMSSQQLADTSATMHAYNSSKAELEESFQKLQVENVRLEAELKHERQKTDMLQKDLVDSQKVRSSLEALCSNLKSTNSHLEEKLGPDQLKEVTQSVEKANAKHFEKEAEDHKALWDQEVLSRSKLGLRIAQLERHKQETSSQLEEEKRRTRKALEQKKAVESRLELEQDKSSSLQKEVASLKAYLKVAKKRLKEPGNDDAMDSKENRLSSLNSAFEQERQAMEEMIVSVKSQLETMKIQLQDETEEKERAREKNTQLENELRTLKKLERSVQKIDRSKRKLEEEFRSYKSSVETGYTDKASVEEARKEIEAQYRLELNRKLDEVNNYLEEQARTRQRLDLSRDEQEAKIRSEKKKFEEECTDLRIKYEQAVAKLETKDLEARRYRDLYESEMQWRMRLSEQLYRSTDKAFSFKNNAERQRNRMFGSLTNVSMNGHTIDLSKINGNVADDALSNRLRAELDRSIAKHLEAAPHDQIQPLVSRDDPVLSSSNFAKASADYIEVLKRKYCV